MHHIFSACGEKRCSARKTCCASTRLPEPAAQNRNSKAKVAPAQQRNTLSCTMVSHQSSNWRGDAGTLLCKAPRCDRRPKRSKCVLCTSTKRYLLLLPVCQQRAPVSITRIYTTSKHIRAARRVVCVVCMYVRGIPQGDMYVHGVAQGRGELGGGCSKTASHTDELRAAHGGGS